MTEGTDQRVTGYRRLPHIRERPYGSHRRGQKPELVISVWHSLEKCARVGGRTHSTMANTTNDEEKQAAARASLRFVTSGKIVGLGSGSTATYAVRFLVEQVRSGLRIRGIPTSKATEKLARSGGIPLTTLDEVAAVDVTIDGADEFDPQLNLIKGGGGNLLREKIVASASKFFVIIADSSKQVPMLGKFPLPVEVIPFAQTLIKRKIEALGAKVKVRESATGDPYITDEGHHLLDCDFGRIPDPAALAQKLETMPGVVEHGLFLGMANVVLLAKGSEVQELRRS